MDRLFLDANVLFSAAYLQVNALQGLWTLANVELISSDVARREAETNLAKKRPARLPGLAVLLQSVNAVPDAPLAPFYHRECNYRPRMNRSFLLVSTQPHRIS